MSAAALRFEALGAGYGDALLLSCPHDGRDWRLLIDTGPDECWPMLKERLSRLPADAQGRRHIDLAVISHIDHDHIGAAKALFDDRSLGLSFGDVWFNAPPRMATRGVAEGQTLADLLGAARRELPWNSAWQSALAVTTESQPFIELPAAAGAPRLTLLSPTPATLARLFKVWARELAKLRRPAKPATPTAASRGLGGPDIEALAARVTATDHAPANGSSIALLLEHRGASVLLAADAYAPVLTAAIEALAAHRGVALPWQVDVFKLSHHGSRANVTTSLLKTVQASHCVISTSGAIFGHPDDEAIARVVLHGRRPQTLWFNHANEESARWAAAGLQRWGCDVRVPASGSSGVVIELGGGGTLDVKRK